MRGHADLATEEHRDTRTPMLTIFTIPKAFEGHDGVIQRNAIESWTRLEPACEIILCADDPGTAQATEDFQVRHLPNIERNECGTPLLSSAFDQVREVASNDILCYVNGDIILFNDLLSVIQRVDLATSIVTGRRLDIDLDEPWDFDSGDWQKRLRKYAAERGKLHSVAAMDYFVFSRRSAIGRLPAFAVGRPGWDNWVVCQARKLDYRVIDATRVLTVVHQNHSYDHVPVRSGVKSRGPEGDRNVELAGGRDNMFTLLDATHIMTPKAVLPALGPTHLLRRLEMAAAIGPAVRRLEALVRRARKRLKLLRNDLLT